MDLSQRIQAKTDNGDTIIDFLVEVMNGQRDDFKICHRLDAARLLRKYGWDEATDFIVDNLPEPSQRSTSSGSSRESLFDTVLAKKIQESTDDGATVCRFLVNVMDGNLKQFRPHHRISAARELLSRGFGKHAPPRRSGEEPAPYSIRGRNPEEVGTAGSHPSAPNGQAPKSHKSPNPTNQSSDNLAVETDEAPDDHEERWARVWEEVTPIIEEAQKARAEHEPDPDNPPYTPDYSVFDEAMENSLKWFQEWKNSINPQEYRAIVKETSERFSARLDARIERRNQIKKEREQREKEEAERQVRQAKAREKAEAEAKEEEDVGPPPDREDHERWSPTPNIPTSFRLRNCGHPKCKLHDGPVYYPEDDRNSPYYNPGHAPPIYGHYPL